jgi:hypothetical protein
MLIKFSMRNLCVILFDQFFDETACSTQGYKLALLYMPQTFSYALL